LPRTFYMVHGKNSAGVPTQTGLTRRNHRKRDGSAVLTMGRSRSQHRFSLAWRYNVHSSRSAAAVEGQPVSVDPGGECHGDRRSRVSLILRARIAPPPAEWPERTTQSLLVSGSPVGEGVECRPRSDWRTDQAIVGGSGLLCRVSDLHPMNKEA